MVESVKSVIHVKCNKMPVVTLPVTEAVSYIVLLVTEESFISSLPNPNVLVDIRKSMQIVKLDFDIILRFFTDTSTDSG